MEKEVGSTHVVQAPSSQAHRREKQILRKIEERTAVEKWWVIL